MTKFDCALGTPNGNHPTRALLLGSGELGKEVAISLTRLGVRVIAADSYAHAPAQQVAHEARVLDMANADALRALIADVDPDIIIPEVEAIATSVLEEAEHNGAHVVPSAKIAGICMDREALRTLAADGWDCRRRRSVSRVPSTNSRRRPTRSDTRASSSRS